MAGIRRFGLVLLVLAGLFPWTRLLALAVFSILAHEWAHSVAAQWCGARVDTVRPRPFGMMARVRGMDNLHPRARLFIYLAGPVFNLALAAWGMTVHYLSYVGVLWLRDLAYVNVVLAVFNLLPVLPLDGGRVAQHFLGNLCGILRANRALLRFGRCAAVLLIILGLVQVVLFSYNVTLLVAGLFLWKRNTQLAPALRLEAFLTLLKKPAVLRGSRGKKRVKIKPFTISDDQPILRAAERLGWSYLREFHIPKHATDTETNIIPEEALLAHLFSDLQATHKHTFAHMIYSLKKRGEAQQ